MANETKTRAETVEERIASLTPERREVLARVLGRQTPGRSTSTTPQRNASIPRRTSNESLPLSFAQERLWFLDQFAPGSPFYNVANALRIRFPLNVEALERSYNETVRRQEALRTTFHTVSGKPVQVIADSLDLPMDVRDLRHLPIAEREGAALRIATEEARRPFNLAQGPLVRTALIQMGAADYLLLLSMHHIVSDGWSMNVFANEITQLYTAFCKGQPSPLPDLPIQYADFAVWQRQWLEGAVFEGERAYWKKQLADLPALQMPTDRPRPTVMSYRGARRRFVIADSVSEKLKALSQREGVTLFMTLLAAFQILLHRYTGQNDIVIGAPVANRNHSGLEGLIGFFVNTLVLRTDMSRDPSFLELLARVRQTSLDAYAHQELPFEKLVEELHPDRDMSRNPLFQVCFQIFNVQSLAENLFQPWAVEAGVAKFDLQLDLLVGPQSLNGFFEYSTDLFDDSTIARLVEHFLALLDAIASDPEQRVSQLPLLTPAEQRQILMEWNDTRSEYPSASVHEQFQAQVKRSPDAIAVVFGPERLTYSELNRRANRLAHYLRSRGVGLDSRVGIFLERSVDMVVAQLGILKAGGAYVPLDPEYPAERLAFVLEDSDVSLLLTRDASRDSLPERAVEVVRIDRDLDPNADAEDLQDESCPESLAYVMYTSGSTGKPKGIAIPHLAISRLVCNTNYISLGPADRVAQASSASFDAATFEIWGALLNGASLIGVPKEVLLSPPGLASLLENEKVTTLFLTTDLFNQYSSESPGMFRSLRTLLFGGSAVSLRWVREVVSHGPPERLLHVYGPTESTTFASWHEVREVSEGATTIPIGRPVSNTQLYVLDRYGDPVPIGAVGELYIGGDGLARGYLNCADMTAKKFVANRFASNRGARLYRTGDLVRYRPDGDLDFVGRVDHQVKVRGFRVELGEIETVLRHAPGVKQCVVITRQDTPGAKSLVAYVEAEGQQSSDTAELRSYLKERLPDYMVPSAFVMLAALPLTPNGKVDHKALVAPEARPAAEKEYAEPASPAEKMLASIWAQVLGRERVGVHDNFFELGGDSIISIQIIARAKEAGLRLTVRQLFHNPTIAELAAVAGTETLGDGEQGTLEGEVPLTPIQMWFFEQGLADPNHFNQAVLLETAEGLDPALIERATEHLLIQHDALRLRYRKEGRWRQFYEAAPQSVPFGMVDLSTVEDSELRARIERSAEEAQGSLDLAVGPILRVIWFDLGKRPGRLLFVIHHLAVDSVSWRTLMEDFWAAYENLARGGEIIPPPKTTSVRQWARRLSEYAETGKAREELTYWVAAATDEWRVPVDLPGGDNLSKTVRTVTVEFDEEETRALLQDTPKAYQTQINDVLLTALTQALGQWAGTSVVRINLEGHGREPLFDDVDLTRTVGWFTTIFPVRLSLPSNDPGEALKSVKEQLRRIPNRGLTYGVLRYLSRDPRVVEQLTAGPTPEVSFNYLGQYASTAAPESTGPERSPRSQRRHLLEIDGAISEGRLRVLWRYSENYHRHRTIERVAGDFIGHLRSLIAHCRATKAGSFTPSDFAKARISQKDLDKLVASMKDTEERGR